MKTDALSADILVVDGLTRRFGTAGPPVIENLSFAIPRGGRVALFAPTGAGKSTLINILTGLERADSGTFMLAARRPATVFQEPRLLPHMTVEENILLPIRMRRMPLAPSLLARYEGWLAVCDLAAYTKHYPYQLSGGMKQKVALIRSFLTEPDFVMLDEPFKSLDPRAKQQIVGHILATYPGISLLFVTHAIEEIPLLAQSLLRFREGRLASYTLHDAARVDTTLMEAFYAKSES
jgi:ABC-type nitrate/sulfonate/bicarbonate transport system ATPase subunit